MWSTPGAAATSHTPRGPYGARQATPYYGAGPNVVSSVVYPNSGAGTQPQLRRTEAPGMHQVHWAAQQGIMAGGRSDAYYGKIESSVHMENQPVFISYMRCKESPEVSWGLMQGINSPPLETWWEMQGPPVPSPSLLVVTCVSPVDRVSVAL